MANNRTPRRNFYLLWVDGIPIPAMKSMCFPEALAKDLAVGLSKKTQKDVFILKATHVTYANSPQDIEIRELIPEDPYKKKEE